MAHGYKTDTDHRFRQRCKMVLLKCEGYSAKQIAGIVNSTMAGAYKWLNGYDTAGIAGLRTPSEQGRKPMLAEAHSKSGSGAAAAAIIASPSDS